MQLDVVGATYQDDNLSVNAQQCINLYVNRTTDEEGAVSSQHLVTTPGLKEMIDLDAETTRAIITHRDRLFCVVDDEFHELHYSSATDSMTNTSRGTIATPVGAVMWATNPTQIMIADVEGGTGYIFNVDTNTFSTISDGDFEEASSVTFLDSYFIYSKTDASAIYQSDENDGTSYNTLNVATPESKGDLTVAVAASNGELWVFGTETIEVWYNAANATGFVFSPRDNAVFDVGCASAQTVTTFRDAIYWLDPNGAVFKAVGYDIQQISTRVITSAINSYDDLSDAHAYNYVEDGHQFYVLTIPSADKTWVYDDTTGLWHERSYRDSDGAFHRTLAFGYAFHQRQHFVGAYNSGKIYRSSRTLYSDDDNPIVRTRVTRHGNLDNKLLTVYHVDLLMETGIGLVTGQGSDPQILMAVSKDGGHTYGNDIIRSVGSIGEYAKMVRWNRIGTARNFTFKFTMSDPVPYVIINGSTNAEVEP